MAPRTLWNALRSPGTWLAIFSQSVSPVLQTIYQTLEEQRQIIDRLKRYEDSTYSLVARRVVSLQHELAGIFRAAPEEPVIMDSRVQERRKVQRPGTTDRSERDLDTT